MVTPPDCRGPGRTPGRRPDGISLPDLVQVVRRRWMLLIVPVALGLLFFAYRAMQLQPWYEAEIHMLAEQLDDYESYEPMAPVWLEDHIAAIRTTVHRPSFVEDVARRFDLAEPVDGQIPPGTLSAISAEIWVEQTSNDTFKIGYTGGEPETVAAVTNGLGEIFIDHMQQARTSRTGQVNQVVDAELERLEAKLEQQEAELEAYKRRSGQALPENLPVLVGEVATLRSELALKTDELAGLEADRAQIAAELEMVRDSGIAQRDPKIEELQETLAQLRKRYTEEHPEVTRVRQELAAMRETRATANSSTRDLELKQIQLESRLRALDQRIAAARELRVTLQSQLGSYQGQIASMPHHERELSALMRDYEVTQEAYDELLARKNYTSVSQQLAASNRGLSFRVIEKARTPTAPAGPARSRELLMGLIIGLTLAVGLTLLVEQMDTTFDDADDFTAATSLPVIGSIPSIPAKGHPRSGGGLGKRRLPTHYDPTGTASEQYRILAMRLRDVMDNDGSRLLMVTSGAGGEGKTTTAVNLAVALSQLAPGEVVLVDGDLRRPRVHAYMGEAETPEDHRAGGLEELLASPDADPASYARRLHGLDVIGSPTHTADTSATLPKRAPEVLRRLSERYRYVVVDAPPLLPMVDGHLLASMVDHVLFVVRARHTRREVVERALELFDFAKVRGVVMNDVDYRGKRYAHAYRYYEQQYVRAAGQQVSS